MAKYRKKPIVIEAVQWFHGVKVPGATIVEDAEVTAAGIAMYGFTGKQKGIIRTLEGGLTITAGDWVCGPGAAGEYWPVRNDIFLATYERAE